MLILAFVDYTYDIHARLQEVHSLFLWYNFKVVGWPSCSMTIMILLNGVILEHKGCPAHSTSGVPKQRWT